MDCKELSTPSLLIRLFREKIDKELNRIFNCFYENYYRLFVNMVRTISQQHTSLQSDPEFYASQAFTDALLLFQQKLSVSGFTEGNATLKTYFLKFCRLQLLAIAQKEKREGRKMARFAKDTLSAQYAVVEEDVYTERELLANKVLDLMDERHRAYFILRKRDGLSNEVIAEKMGIAPGTVNNEVYRSFMKVKSILASLKGKS